MKINKLRNILVISLIMTGTIQVIPVMAAPSTGAVTSWQDAEAGKAIVPVHSKTSDKDGVPVDGMTLDVAKGTVSTDDPNREDYKVNNDTNPDRRIERYTHPDGTPYTGLYLVKGPNGGGIAWDVLDKDGFYQRDQSMHQFAWDGSKECADFVVESGPNINAYENKYYLGKTEMKDGGIIAYIQMNAWLQPTYGGAWYHSNDKGICYRNQWFQDTDGKWYYFGDDCKMVTNTTIGGYTIGADGVCE